MKRNFRKPLIVMTPKSLLRHKAAVSPVEEFTDGRFHEVLDDADGRAGPRPPRAAVQRQGLLRPAAKRGPSRGATTWRSCASSSSTRFPEEQLRQVLGRYRQAKEWVWVQEESQNMGGWSFMEPRLRALGYDVEIRRPRRQRQPGDRLAPGPRARAGGTGRGGADAGRCRTWSGRYRQRSVGGARAAESESSSRSMSPSS